MKTDIEFVIEMIKCPACDTVQAAIVELVLPFGRYIHDCVACEYTIMESEWDVVKPFVLNPTDELNLNPTYLRYKP